MPIDPLLASCVACCLLIVGQLSAKRVGRWVESLACVGVRAPRPSTVCGCYHAGVVWMESGLFVVIILQAYHCLPVDWNARLNCHT